MKLKGIQIDAFRVYKDPENFEFLASNGSVADLVVIYGPNGFGKTSFFDAIEWSFTNKIKRISGNIEVKKVAEFEKENILKNMYSKNPFGRVKIITDENKILELKTLELNGSRMTDYAPGKVLKDEVRTAEITNGFHARNIITSDKLDEFLRFQKPSERYKVLEDFWDDNKESMLYFNVISMYGEANKVYSQTTKIIESNIEDIKRLAFVSKKINDINDLLDIYNVLNNESKNHIEDNVNNSTINKYLNYFTERKLFILSEEKIYNGNYNELNELVTEYNKYKHEKECVILLNEKIRVKNLILQKNNENEKCITKLNFGYKSLEQIKLKLKRLTIVKGNAEFFIDAIEKITTHNKEINKLLEIKVKIAEKTNKIVKDKEKLNIEKGTNQSQKLKLVKNMENVKQNIEDYYKYKSDINKYNRMLLKLSTIINSRQMRMDKFLIRKKELQYYLQDDKEILFSNKLENAGFIGCKALYNSIITMKAERKNINQKYKSGLSLNSKLDKIISTGRIFIKENKLTKCPLCNKEYEKIEILLGNLDINIEGNFSIKEIEEEKLKIDKLIFINEKELTEDLVVFYNDIRREIEINHKGYEFEKKKADRCMLLREKKELKLKYINTEANNIKKAFENLGIRNDFTEHNNYKESFEPKISKIEKTLTYIDNLLNGFELEQKRIQNHYSESERLININKIQIEAIVSHEQYLKVQECLSYLEIEFDINKINDIFTTLNIELKTNEKDNEALHTRITELTSETCKYKIDDLSIEINTVRVEMVIKTKTIDKYEKRYRKYVTVDNEQVQLNKLSEIVVITKKTKDKMEGQNKNISLIIENIGYITQNEARVDLINKKKVLIDKRTKIKGVVDKLYNHKVQLEEILNDKVNLAFNSDCINSIYKRLEPHPNMNNIKFVPNFIDGKAMMNIYTYSDDDKENMKAPILYFSAAQVNILSLSIFLAKALQKSNGLDTIFMDEPVQHLDSINILSFVDLIRTVAFGKKFNKQIIISTSNSNFYNIIKRKLDPSYYNSKFIEFESYGKIHKKV